MDHVKAGVAAIWALFKDIAGWCWAQIVATWKTACGNFRNIAISFAQHLQERMRVIAMERGVEVD